jgi:uncharacterized protein
MPKNKNQLRAVAHPSTKSSAPSKQPPTVSGRWLLGALGITLVAAIFCAWASLCLLFWQGHWQLLYHPTAIVARTPASVGVTFEPVGFAATETGQLRLQGWWIPAAADARFSQFTVLYLHGQNGNLGDSVDALAQLHSVGVNILAFDYRGYGQSQFVRPSETHWRQDAEWALAYLTQTRHIDSHKIVLHGDRLGANLAVEVAAAHPELGGVVLESPLEDPVSAIFNDPRARLIPAHELARDRYDLSAAATALRIPSLWFLREGANQPAAYRPELSPKMLVWLGSGASGEKAFSEAYARWLDGLATH